MIVYVYAIMHSDVSDVESIEGKKQYHRHSVKYLISLSRCISIGVACTHSNQDTAWLNILTLQAKVKIIVLLCYSK